MALLYRRHVPICISCSRAFTTSSPSHLELRLKDPATEMPPYPYGAAQWYKQSDAGLYGGQRIRFGNNVGPKSGTKSRRSWSVNVFSKRLFSKSLDRFIQLKVSKKVLKTIDKEGGLDEYLLADKESRIKSLGLKGWELRWAIMQTPQVQRRLRKERQELGLEGLEATVEKREAERRRREEKEALERMQSADPVELDVHADIEPVAESTVVAEASTPEQSDPASWEDVEDFESRHLITANHLPRLRIDHNKYMLLTPRGWRARAPQPSRGPTPPLSHAARARKVLRRTLPDASIQAVAKAAMNEQRDALRRTKTPMRFSDAQASRIAMRAARAFRKNAVAEIRQELEADARQKKAVEDAALAKKKAEKKARRLEARERKTAGDSVVVN